MRFLGVLKSTRTLLSAGPLIVREGPTALAKEVVTEDSLLRRGQYLTR